MILRDELDMLAVGDIRRVLIALSETEESVEKLLNYRFKSEGTLNKHTVGNIMLAAATEMAGSVQKGVELLGNVLNLSGKILPVTESNVTLVGKMEDGSIVEGEHNITASEKNIKNVFYKEKPVIKTVFADVSATHWAKESIQSFAAHQATMVIFLSTGMLEELSKRLIEGGYTADTPAAIVYKATWEDEKKFICTVGTLAQTARENNITKTALMIIGDVVKAAHYDRSRLYDPGFTTEFREASV